MNCADCETEPLTPGHYCPCCGRKLSLQERGGGEAPPQTGRCPSCGGASAANGVLCKSCQQAFAPVLGNAHVVEPSDQSAAAPQKTPTIVKTTTVATPPIRTVVAAPHKVVETSKIDPLTSDTARTVADQTAKAHLAKAANPPPVTRRPVVPLPPQTRSRRPVLMAAAALVVVIGAAEGARRLGYWPPAAPEEQTAQATADEKSAAAPEREPAPAMSHAAPQVTAGNAVEPVAPARAAARPKPRPGTETRSATRRANPPQQAATVVEASPAPEPPAAPQTPAPAAASSQGEPAQPTGRFFERNDVDESPQIATRVEPQLPPNLTERAPNDVVVVRVLVSRTGHPFRVSLLRGSRLGRSADEAVVAAVTRWTFSPARKRGEAVHCWYNIGVPLGRAD